METTHERENAEFRTTWSLNKQTYTHDYTVHFVTRVPTYLCHPIKAKVGGGLINQDHLRGYYATQDTVMSTINYFSDCMGYTGTYG